jgi:outer membrane autotransporter protein
MKITGNRVGAAHFKRAAIWLAVLSAWEYSGWAMAACTNSVAGAIDQDVPLGTCVYVPTVGSANAALIVDGAGGPAMVTASGSNTYHDTDLGSGTVGPYSAFIRVSPLDTARQDAQLTLNGSQTLSVSPGTAADGMDVLAGDTGRSATVDLNGADLELNVGSGGATGVQITGGANASASVNMTNSTMAVDTGGLSGIQVENSNAALTSTGTQNTLTIGTRVVPTRFALKLTQGGKVDFAGRMNFNSGETGIQVLGNSVLRLDGVDASQSSVNATGAQNQYALGLDYESTDTTGTLHNVAVNLSANTQVAGSGSEGFNVNLESGALDIRNVRLASNMIDSGALTVAVGGVLTGSGLAVDVSGKGTGGIDVEPNATGSLTLDGTSARNTIVTRGAADYSPIYTDLPYSNAAGVRLLGGSISLAGTDIETYGNGAPGIYLSKGAVTTGTGVSVSTHGDGASGIVYTPLAGTASNVTTAFSATTSVRTSGSGAYGFVADGSDLYDGTGTPHPFSLQFSSTGLSAGSIAVAGAGSAAIGARGEATLVLDGQNLSALAALPSGTYAVEAESGGKVQFKAGATAAGASLLAGSGGTLDFNDDSASASGSVVAISQGNDAASRGELDLSGRTQALHVGQLASVGSGSTNGLVDLGGNSVFLDGSNATPATFSGTIQGTGGLTKSGTGVQIVSGQDVFDYTGATIVAGGTLAVAGGAVGRDANGFKLLQLPVGGALDIGNNQGRFETGAMTGFGTVHLTDSGTGASSNLILEGTGTAQTFAGTIDGSGGLVLRGNANQKLVGSGVFGFTGDVTLGGGLLAVGGNANALANRFTFDDGANTGGTLDISAISGSGFTLAGVEATNRATTAQIKLGSTSSASANLVLAGSGNYSFDGTISGYGDVVKQGNGTQTMSGAKPFSFTGTTVLDAGVLQLRNIADPSQFDQTFELNGGWLDLSDSTFDSSGQNVNDWAKLHVTDGTEASQGGIIGSSDKITLGGNTGDTTEAAQIDDGVFVVKTGTNTTTLTGMNTYAGNTRILGGTLKVANDANLGSTAYEREVVLDGGNLEIGTGGTFASSRQLQLQVAGAVRVDGTSASSATLGSIAGSGQTFTKTGGGTLTFTNGGSVGQVIASVGALDLRSAKVDATTLSDSGQPAIEQAAGTTVSLEGATVVSQGDAIVANGTSTLNLSGNTQVTAGGATYRVTSGTGTLNASGESLLGNVLQADGSGSALAVNLTNHSSYTGTPSLTAGATATLSIDGSSAWTMTGDTELAGVTNDGAITFGAASPTATLAKAQVASPFIALTVNGNYQGSGVLNLRTELNEGGVLANQHTDRLIVTGNVSGQRTLSLTTSGSGANTDTAHVNQAIPTEGISVVQVEGASTASAFALQGGYVAAPASPYQYRIFAYGPGGYGLPDASQSVLPDGKTPTWDYRLQTSYIDGNGHVQPGPGPYCCARPSVVPQVSSYLTLPLALQNYESVVTDNLYRRLGDVRHGAFDARVEAKDVFARTIDSRSMYHSNRGFSDYGYDFGQYIGAVQFGADWLHRRSEESDFRLGTAVTLGHSWVYPRAAAAESSHASIDAYNLALTGTWQHRDGWYVDGVLSLGWYTGDIDTSQRGEAGRMSAKAEPNAYNGSFEAGRSFALANGVEIEPHARLLAQLLRFPSHQDADALEVRTGNLFALTGLVGARMSMVLPNTVSFRPYVRVDFAYTQMNSPSVTLSGLPFGVGAIGGAVQLGLGASGRVTPNFSVYGELSGQQRLGPGMSTLAATLGLRYAF